MAKREEEEERKKMKDRPGPGPGPSIKYKEEEETIRLLHPEKRKRHTEEQKSKEAFPGGWPLDKMKAWEMMEGVHKILYLCFSTFSRSNTVSYSIKALYISSDAVRQVGRFILDQGRRDMGFGAFGSKLVLAGGVESIFDGFKYRSCPSKDIYVVEMDINKPVIQDPRRLFNNTTLQHGKCRPLVAQHDGKLYVLSTFCLKTLPGDAFTGGFEMFDPKVGKWVTLPQSPTFGCIRSCRVTSCVVAGSNIFVATLYGPVYRFDMADPNHQWKQHNFTEFTPLEFAMRFGSQTLAVETRHGDWVLFTCKEEVHQVADDRDYPKDDNYEMFDDFHRLFEWKGTSMPVYLMSKDLTSLTALEPLKLPPFNTIPTFPQRVRSIEHKMVHLGGQNVCLILSVDTGEESKDSVDTGDKSEDGAMRNIEIFLIIFEFEIVESIRALAFKNFSGPWRFTHDFILPSELRATRVGMLGAIFL